ncbi:MAG: arginase family protein [Bacillota bacterium]|nr:arginase family protein [Bacillota bacterium]
MIRDLTAQVVKDGKLLLIIGGEHLVALDAVEALAK